MKKRTSNSKLRRKSLVTTTTTSDVIQSVISNDVLQGGMEGEAACYRKITNDIHSRNSVPNMAVEPQINQSPSEFLTTPVAISTSISTPGTSAENDFYRPLSVETPPGTSIMTDRINDDYLPSTQIVDNRVLKNVVAYVEVRSTNDNRSEAICKELELLGADVSKKFTDNVTHVVFKEGTKRTKTKAAKLKVHLVSVLWVDSCKQYQEHVSERLYPAFLPTNDKGSVLFLAKLKKAKSMQPSNFDDDVANSAERCTNKRKRQFVDRLQTSDNTPQNSPNLGRILVQETQPRTPIDMNTPIKLLIPDTPPSMRKKMIQLKFKDSDTPVLGNEKEEPLQRRLFDGLPNSSFDTNDVDHLMGSLQDEINNCINNMPESPVPCDVYSRQVSSPSNLSDKNRPSPQTETTNDILVPQMKPCQKSSKSNKRRKSIATVKFVDDDTKPKRPYKRRKSVAIVNPSKIVEEIEKTELTALNKQTETRAETVEEFEKTEFAALNKQAETRSDNISSGGIKSETNQLDVQNKNNNKDDESNSLIDNKIRKLVEIKRTSSVTKRKSTKQSIEDSKNSNEKSQEMEILVSHDTMTTDQGKSSNDQNRGVGIDAGFSHLNPTTLVSSSIDTVDRAIKKRPQKTNNKKKLLPRSDMNPVLPPLPKTQGRKRKIESESESSSNISAFFPSQPAIHKRPRINSLVEKTGKVNCQTSTITSCQTSAITSCQTSTITSCQTSAITSCQTSAITSCQTSAITSNKVDKTEITMTDDLTLQETTVNSSTTTQSENSMSAVFGESLLNSLPGRIQPRPSIDEFNLHKGIKPMQRHKTVSTSSQRQSDSDSSDSCQSKKAYRRSPPSRPTLVMTSLHAEEQDVVISVVKQLGRFAISDNVTDSTTHLICGGPRRTLNVLYGIMKGIWIVHKHWVLSSLEAKTWLPEENYEVTDYFPIVKVTREGRYLHKENYQQLSLSIVGSIYIAQKTSPPRQHLLTLLKMCGAKVINNPNKADIYMGHEFVPDKICVNPLWVLDCITQQRQLDNDRYLLGRPKRESSPEF